jgi:hypothetical protein
MKYVLLIYTDEKVEAAMNEAEQKANYDAYFAFTDDVRARGLYVSGEALHPINTATTVRVRDGKTLTTDGPFAETREQLGGYYVLDCKDLDEAIEAAVKIPGAKHGSIEIRPLMVFEGLG